MKLVSSCWSALRSRNVFCLTLCAALIAFCSPANGQTSRKLPRVGFIATSPGSNFERFKHGLRDLGYVEGIDLMIEPRFLEGKLERVPTLVTELVDSEVDVIVAAPITAIRAAKKATKTIPVVMVTSQDPVAWKLIDSLARPGGNITGIARLTRELSGKRLELLTEAVPGLSRVGILGDSKLPGSSIAAKEYEDAARRMKLKLEMLSAAGPEPDLQKAFKRANEAQLNALITIGNPVLNRLTKQIAELARKGRIASMFESREYVEVGGLISYSTNDEDVFRRAAFYVDKILKGAKPVDLPVEQPTKFELVINLKTAKQIGLAIPPNVLARADRVIR